MEEPDHLRMKVSARENNSVSIDMSGKKNEKNNATYVINNLSQMFR